MDWLRGAVQAVQSAVPGREPTTALTVAGRRVLQGRLLADGGFAYVYSGEDAESGEKLAIRKVLLQDAEALEKAQLEMELLGSLCDHPHVVRFLDAEIFRRGQGAASAQAVYLFELCTGGTLLAKLEKAMAKATQPGASAHRPQYCCPCLKQKHVLEVLSATAQALAYLSRLGMIHYDVKSENLLLGADGLWKLGDFGSASERSWDLEGATKKVLFEAQEFIHGRCTPMYRAPELADVYLRWKIGPKVDIFALGCIVFATMTGQHPFPMDSACGNISANYQVPPEATTAYAPAILKWLRRCLAREPKKRPSAVKLAAEVERFKALGEEPPDLANDAPVAPAAVPEASWVADFANFSPPPRVELSAAEPINEVAQSSPPAVTAPVVQSGDKPVAELTTEPAGDLVKEVPTPKSTEAVAAQPAEKTAADLPAKPEADVAETNIAVSSVNPGAAGQVGESSVDKPEAEEVPASTTSIAEQDSKGASADSHG